MVIKQRYSLTLESPKENYSYLERFIEGFLTKRPYFQKAIQDLDIEASLLYLNKATDTCHEKAELISWNPERVVKALYLTNKEDIVCCVFPELDKSLNTKKLFAQTLRISGKQAKRYTNSYNLDDMERGTCTPFLPQEILFNGNPSNIFFHNYPSIDNQLVDISVGGKGEEAHKIAMHIKYNDIYRILETIIADKIKKINLFSD